MQLMAPSFSDVVIEFDAQAQVITIKDGYLITNDTDKKQILTEITADKLVSRSMTSLLREWKAHNTMYQWGWFKSHTTDTDLDKNEKLWRRICYWFLAPLEKQK